MLAGKILPTVNHRDLDWQSLWGLRRRGRVASMNRLLRVRERSKPYIPGPPNVRCPLHQYVVRWTTQWDPVAGSSTCQNRRWAEQGKPPSWRRTRATRRGAPSGCRQVRGEFAREFAPLCCTIHRMPAVRQGNLRIIVGIIIMRC
jgi:hypothetical protein